MEEHSNAERLQKQHFDAIASEYAKHYGDTWSQRYRQKFINVPLLEGIDLSGKRVIDAMCGSGETTGYLLQRGAQVTGVDISQKQIEQFQSRFPNCKAQCSSILSTGLESESYDCVVVVIGLHHLHPKVSEAIDEIYRVLKVGGYFCFVEPHTGSLADLVRQSWYRRDSLFEENEAAINLEVLKQEFSSKFKFLKEKYKGNLAYLFILQSLVLRIPLKLKPVYSPALMWMESMIEPMQGRRSSCFVVAQWQKAIK